jgi:hypothetical protein
MADFAENIPRSHGRLPAAESSATNTRDGPLRGESELKYGWRSRRPQRRLAGPNAAMALAGTPLMCMYE